MLCKISNPARFVNSTIMIPTPAGAQGQYDRPAPANLDARLITDLPRGLTCRWRSDMSGVACVDPLPLQIVYRGVVTESSFVEMQPVTLLVNGRLTIGNAPFTYRYVGTYYLPSGAVCRYDIESGPLPVPGLSIYVASRALLAIWEDVYESNSTLYQMFEDLADGLDILPERRIALFASWASAAVFKRLFPEYDVYARQGGESQ